MANLWFISDTHFNHDNILNFKDEAGNLIRPGFSSVQDMNEKIVENWNAVVRPGDIVKHVGDVAFKMKAKADEIDVILGRLNGTKHLIPGNHDPVESPILQKHFSKITLWEIFQQHNFTLSHIPLRLDMMRDTRFNVHGHTHQKVMGEPEYINVCVEWTAFAPIHIDDILTKIKERQ